LLYDADVWARFRAVAPDERVLFGSDFPLNVYPKLDAAPDMTRLVAEAKGAGASAAILRENAAKLLSR
jgi:predicted TIM-barrel fold metal-dependent hydrolase